MTSCAAPRGPAPSLLPVLKDMGMRTPNIRAALLACAALACGPQTRETAGATATTGNCS